MQDQRTSKGKNHVEYELTEHRLLRISNAMGRRVECVSGRALITAYGEATDFTVREGTVFIIPNNGLTLIEAIGNGRIRIKSPALPGLAWMARTRRHAAEALRRLWNGIVGDNKIAP